MRILSLNIRGLGGSVKQKILRHLLKTLSPDVVLLQETMTSTYPTLFAFSKLCPGWEFCALDSLRLSRGILSGWNPRVLRCKAYHTLAGILLKATLRGFSVPFSILNVYGPYSHRDTFWNAVAAGGLLSIPNLILAGDLNFTLNASEVWGSKALLDPMGPYLSSLFYSHHLVDIAPSCAGPTWRNGRSGVEGISKRLDHFLLSEQLIGSFPRHRVWTHRCSISDHFPILLDWGQPQDPCLYPYKFNHTWLEYEGFCDMIRHTWSLPPSGIYFGRNDGFLFSASSFKRQGQILDKGGD